MNELQYQELFSVCQAFSGPGSTKMHYCINLIHNGFISAVLGFLIWRYVTSVTRSFCFSCCPPDASVYTNLFIY